MFDCQYGKDRKAGEKRKREDAEEVNKILYCIYILFFLSATLVLLLSPMAC